MLQVTENPIIQKTLQVPNILYWEKSVAQCHFSTMNYTSTGL